MVSTTQKWDVREKLAGEKGLLSGKNSEEVAVLGCPLVFCVTSNNCMLIAGFFFRVCHLSEKLRTF